MNMNMSSINDVVINGTSYSGKNISINNNKVTIDGVVQSQLLDNEVNVIVHGNVNTLNTEAGSVTTDSVGSVSTMSGSVTCGNVQGNVETMSGSVKANNITGDVDTMSGNIKYKK